MNKFAVVLGVAAVATLAGCKDPNYGGKSNDNDVKVVNPNTAPAPVNVDVATPAPITPIVVPVVPHCSCPPGTTHTSPCTCGAPDCKCVVVAKPVTPAPAPAVPAYTVYVVQRGDYLAKISKKFNLTIGSIKRLNNMTDDKIRVGQKLKLPGKVDVGIQQAPAHPVTAAPAKAVAPAKAFSGATKEYVVKNGDTLGAIALSSGITVTQLRQLNGLQSDSLKIGQKLNVPAEKQVKAAKAPAPVKTPVKAVPKTDTAKTDPVPQKDDEKSAVPVAGGTAKVDVAPVAPAGQTATVPTEKKDPALDEVSPATAPKYNTYTVQEGDDMTGVSIRWGVTAGVIRDLNNLPEDAQLKPGQVLKLPAEAEQ